MIGAGGVIPAFLHVKFEATRSNPYMCWVNRTFCGSYTDPAEAGGYADLMYLVRSPYAPDADFNNAPDRSSVFFTSTLGVLPDVMVQVFRLCAKIHKGMTPPEVMGYLIKHEKEILVAEAGPYMYNRERGKVEFLTSAFDEAQKDACEAKRQMMAAKWELAAVTRDKDRAAKASAVAHARERAERAEFQAAQDEELKAVTQATTAAQADARKARVEAREKQQVLQALQAELNEANTTLCPRTACAWVKLAKRALRSSTRGSELSPAPGNMG